MAIFIYAVLGIGLLVGSGFIITMNPEWWVPVLTAVCGLGCLAIAIYKLEDEYGIFQQRRLKKADKVMNFKFKPKAMNMMPMFIKAYDDRKEHGNDYIMRKAKSNIITGYNAIYKNWKLVARETNYFDNLGGEGLVDTALFDAIEVVLTLLVCLDERLDSDYDVYCGICKALGHKARSKAELTKYAHELASDNYEKASQKCSFFYAVARRCVAPEKFQTMVQGFCYLALSDNTAYEDEYTIIAACFFQKEIDTFPATWEQFKREY